METNNQGSISPRVVIGKTTSLVAMATVFTIAAFLAVLSFASHAGAAANSPKAICQVYINLGITVSIDKNTENDCFIKIGNNNVGFGTVHAYYTVTPPQFCIDTSGSYFPQASSQCSPISSAGKTQPDSKPGQLVTPANFQIKELQYETLPHGKLIQSGDNERIELTMHDGSLIQIGANSSFTPVSDYEVQSVFGRYRYLWQPFHDGKCIVGQNLVRQACRKVKTRDAVLGVTGTEFLVETDKSGTTVTILEGLLTVTDLGGKKTVEVTGGQFTYIKHGGLPAEPAPYDPTKIDRWWEKKSNEQTAKVIASVITAFIFLLSIIFLIREKILGKWKTASGQPQPAKTVQLILFIIMFSVLVIYALSVMGYIKLPKIDLGFLSN